MAFVFCTHHVVRGIAHETTLKQPHIVVDL